MKSERWRQINHIFHEALKRDGAAREAYLQQATADDPDLRREVQDLLASYEKDGKFLERPAWEVEPDLAMGHDQSLVGKQVGSYRIIKEIGRGGMGVVYEAFDVVLKRTVALKALTPEYTRDPKRRERLIHEARAAAALDHPAIATIFALEEIDGELYIVSEFVEGQTLREQLGKGPLPPSDLLPVLVTIADGLAAAHKRGIVHRDLKPENIIRRNDGQIKIVDFGLAQSPEGSDAATRERLTVAGVVVGTPDYMAPEQWEGKKVDARADIFSFGVLIWELATGEHPSGTRPVSSVSWMTELIEGRASRLNRPLSLPGLSEIARRCMRVNPAERYANADALLADLRQPVPPVSPDPLPRPDALWWWQFHQHIVAVVNAAAPALIWAVRHLVDSPGGPRFGSKLFAVTLTLAVISVALRLNLSFTARVHPTMLVDHRARVFPTIATIDTLLALSLLAAGVKVADAHDAIAALLLAFSALMLVSLSLIEPATTKAAGVNRESGVASRVNEYDRRATRR